MSNLFNRTLQPAQLLIPSRLVALAAPEAVAHPLAMRSLALRARRGGRAGVVVGHNRFDLYVLTRLAREQGLDPAQLLAEIELSRAFTCHQLHHRLATLTQFTRRWNAFYVLGLLDTFYDEAVEYHEAVQLLSASLAHLQRIARSGLPVLVTLAPPQLKGRERLLEACARAVDEYWQFVDDAAPPAAPRQLTLDMP